MTYILYAICAFSFTMLIIETWKGRVRHRESKLELDRVRDRFSLSEQSKETLIAANKTLQHKVDTLSEERDALEDKSGLLAEIDAGKNRINALLADNLALTADNREVWSERQKHVLLQQSLENLRPSIDNPQLRYARDSLKNTQVELTALTRKVIAFIDGKITKEELRAAADDTASNAGEFSNMYERALERANTTTALMEDFGKMLPAPKAEDQNGSH